jgi:hypothetical protein
LDGSLVIADAFEGRGAHHLRWHFHFAPNVSIAASVPGVLELRTPKTALRMTVPASLRLITGSGWYSPSYGVRVPCATIDLDAPIALDGRLEYTFQLMRR